MLARSHVLIITKKVPVYPDCLKGYFAHYRGDPEILGGQVCKPHVGIVVKVPINSKVFSPPVA